MDLQDRHGSCWFSAMRLGITQSDLFYLYSYCVCFINPGVPYLHKYYLSTFNLAEAFFLTSYNYTKLWIFFNTRPDQFNERQTLLFASTYTHGEIISTVGNTRTFRHSKVETQMLPSPGLRVSTSTPMVSGIRSQEKECRINGRPPCRSRGG